MLKSTEDAINNVDFSDLSQGGGCTIQDTAMRAISFDQLERMLKHLYRRFNTMLLTATWQVLTVLV